MEFSIVLARIISVIYLSFSLGGLLDRDYYRRISDDVCRSSGLTFITGFLAAIAGYFVVHYHNLWVKDWPVLITLIGWIALGKGIVILMLPKSIQGLTEFFISGSLLRVIPYGAFLIGLILGYFGFLHKAV